MLISIKYQEMKHVSGSDKPKLLSFLFIKVVISELVQRSLRVTAPHKVIYYLISSARSVPFVGTVV